MAELQGWIFDDIAFTYDLFPSELTPDPVDIRRYYEGEVRRLESWIEQLEKHPQDQRADKVPVDYGHMYRFRLNRLHRSNSRASHGIYMVRTLLDYLKSCWRQLQPQIRYVPPVREYPTRRMITPDEAGNFGSAWEAICRDEEMRIKLNSWLGRNRLKTPYEFEVTRFVDEMSPHNTLTELVMRDLNYDTVVSSRDVGFGISQVLPVLVEAFGSNNRIVAIEQPEIHLHPALQADLGDVFITSALGPQRNTFLLETHSEHLLLRIMRRMRDTVNGTLPPGIPPVHPDDVAILFVQPKADGSTSVIEELRLDTDGTLVDHWPGGFFEEGFKERFSL